METDNQNTSNSSDAYPSKPVLAEKKGNNLIRSITSLLFYALLFYFLFERNIVYIAAVLLVLLIHEFGHFLAMKMYNYQNVKLFIIPLIGAFVSGNKQRVSQKQMSIIILAGPLPGIFIGFIFYILDIYFPNNSMKLLGNTFVFLNIFNLLPIYPLDGGRFLENLFIRNNYGIRLVFTILSIIVLTGLALITQSFILLVIPGLMVIELYNEVRNQKIREYLEQEKIDYHLDYNDLPDRNYWLIRDCILFSFHKKYPGINAGNYQYSIMEPMLIQHVKNILKTTFNSDLNILYKIGLVLLYIFFLIGIPILSYVLFF